MIGLIVGQLQAVGIASIIKSSLGKDTGGDRLLQFIINTFSFHAIALIAVHFFLRYHGMTWREFFGISRFRVRMAVWAVGAAAIILPLALMLNTFSAVLLTKLHLRLEEQPSMQALQLSVTLGQKIVFGLAAIVVAPIVEESMFRGIFYPAIKQEGFPRTALFGSSFLFAIIHVNLMTFIPLFVLALVFVFLLDRTDTLLTCILAHSSFNAANFIIYLNREKIEGWWDSAWRIFRHALPF